MTFRLAAYRAGQPPRMPSAAAIPDRVSPVPTVYRAGAGPGTRKRVPARIRAGSGPMTALLAAYRAGQPPGTASAAAIPDRVFAGWTAYRPAGRGAAAGRAAVVSVTRMPPAGLLLLVLLVVVLLVVVLVLLVLAVRMAACAGSADLIMPATARMSRMLQAAITHADFVHTRTVVSLSFRRDQRRVLAGPGR